jgi:Kef-type K+ transport system membrane component KefB
VIDLVERLGEGPGQLGVRFVIMVLLIFVALASNLGFETILGAFVAGALLRFTDRSNKFDEPRFRAKLEGLGYGFLVPAFFIASGLEFDASALFDSPGSLVLLPVLIIGILIVRGVPALFYRRAFGMSHVGAAALLQSTTLSMMVIASQIGQELGTIDSATGAALTAAGIFTVIVFPPFALWLLGRESQLPAVWDEAGGGP